MPDTHCSGAVRMYVADSATRILRTTRDSASRDFVTALMGVLERVR